MKTKMLVAISLLFCNFTFASEIQFDFDKIEKGLTAQIDIKNKELQEKISKRIEANFELQFEKFMDIENLMIQTNLEKFEEKQNRYYNDITE